MRRKSTYRAFTHDVTAAILVFQNNETAVMLVFQPLLWELISFLMWTLSFIPINLHRFWSREWKRSTQRKKIYILNKTESFAKNELHTRRWQHSCQCEWFEPRSHFKVGWVWSSWWTLSWIGLLLLTVTDISTTCALVIFRVKVSCITSVDGIILWLLNFLVNYFAM